jgi:hypothetical protein
MDSLLIKFVDIGQIVVRNTSEEDNDHFNGKSTLQIDIVCWFACQKSTRFSLNCI